MDDLRFASLFSGIGGFDLAFEHAGMRCEAQVEIDKNCLGVLAHHWPNVKRYEDVKNVGRKQFKSVDLVCGGFPCQDLSVAGRRAGLAGERSGLWFEYHRIIASTLPRWVVIENVPGLLSSNAGEDFAIILRGLVECGYGVAWRILDAQYFGLAQRRRRVFIIGSLGNGRAAQVLFESEGVPGDSAPSREAGTRPAFALAASVRGSGDGHGNTWNSNYVAPPLKAQDPGRRNGGSSPIADEFIISETLGSHHGRNDLDSMGAYLIGTLHNGMPGRDVSDAADGKLIAFDWQAGDGGSDDSFRGKSRSYIVRKGEYAQVRANAVDAIAWNWQSGGDVRHDFNERPMLQSSQVPAVGVRRLTPMECERLQGFPDGWTAINGQSDSVRYRQLGNAVAVPVAEWIGKRIMATENE